MEVTDDLTTRREAHMAAVRRLLSGLEQYPEAARGLGRLAAVHMRRADEIERAIESQRLATLAEEFPRIAAR